MAFSSPSKPTDKLAIAPNPKEIKSWDFWRWLILMGLFGSAALALLKVAFFPASFQAQPLVFPPQVELPGWQQEIGISTKLPPAKQASADKGFNFVNGTIYQYRQGQQLMKIELRYFTPITADVGALIGYYHGSNTPPLIRQYQQGLGSYALLTTEGRSHLTTCLNGSGDSTITREEFTQNRYRQDLNPGRIFLWVIGQTSLLDSRCLWVDMSLPNNQTENPSSSYKSLQQAWQNWSQWWKPYFAKQQI